MDLNKVINTDEKKILMTYRYISLITTSLFYLSNNESNLLYKKLLIIICISISSIILSYLYLEYKYKKTVKILIFIETLSNVIILIPSGGLVSPFIWYALNTLLISALIFDYKYLFKNISIYFLLILIVAYISKNIGLNIDYLKGVNSNLVLSLIMIIVFIAIWSIYFKKIQEKNKDLQISNINLEEANIHIKNIYQAINTLNNQGNKEGIINLLFETIENFTKSEMIFYYDFTIKPNKIFFYKNNDTKDEVLEAIETYLNKENQVDENYIYNFINVETDILKYGILGYLRTDNKINSTDADQITFLSEIVSLTFEHFYLQEINDNFLINQEQNRIADEIHDSVLQRLFSISCGIYSLIKRIEILESNEIKIKLNEIRNSTDDVMKSLRDKIYGISDKKKEINSFKADINTYIEEVKQFNDISIPFYMKGNDELLTINMKKAIYRIICEAISNSIRHGKAKKIIVNLMISNEVIKLVIDDNGLGFDIDSISNKGLGLKNISSLVEQINGETKIISSEGNGTKIEIIINRNTNFFKEEMKSYENTCC